MKLPNFFIAGAAKSATSSLWMHLKKHPEIFMPEKKEPSYYCHSYGMKNKENYLRLFENAGDKKIIGEASNTYLTSPESAFLIRKEIPEAKIIIMLRNPSERAYSLYKWMVNNGYEWMHPFEMALKKELERSKSQVFFYKNPQYFYNYLYKLSGMYHDQLMRYYENFPENQIKIILTNEFKKRPASVSGEVLRFIGASDCFDEKIGLYNKSEFRPLSIKLQYILRRMEKKIGKKNAIRAAMNLNMSLFNIKWNNMPLKTKIFLDSEYAEDIKKTSSVILKDLGCWTNFIDPCKEDDLN